jgi:hypothetical protein
LVSEELIVPGIADMFSSGQAMKQDKEAYESIRCFLNLIISDVRIVGFCRAKEFVKTFNQYHLYCDASDVECVSHIDNGQEQKGSRNSV